MARRISGAFGMRMSGARGRAMVQYGYSMICAELLEKRT